MVVMLVGLFIGLLIFFIGLSLVTIYHKQQESKKPEEDIAEERRELNEEELKELNPEQNPTYLLGLLFGAEGLILSVVSVAALLIHGFLIKIPLYISIPFIGVYLITCLVYDSLKMYKE